MFAKYTGVNAESEYHIMNLFIKTMELRVVKRRHFFEFKRHMLFISLLLCHKIMNVRCASHSLLEPLSQATKQAAITNKLMLMQNRAVVNKFNSDTCSKDFLLLMALCTKSILLLKF